MRAATDSGKAWLATLNSSGGSGRDCGDTGGDAVDVVVASISSSGGEGSGVVRVVETDGIASVASVVTTGVVADDGEGLGGVALLEGSVGDD